MDNENNKDYLNSEKGEFIIKKKDDELNNQEPDTTEEKGEFVINKKPIEENNNIKENNNPSQNDNINTSSNYEQNYNFNNSASYNFEEEMQKIKEKNKKKNKKIIGFSIAGVFIVFLIALIALFTVFSGPNYEDYAYNGVEVNKNFEISPDDLILTVNYINENIYENKFNGLTMTPLENLTFNDTDGCYELTIDSDNDLKLIIYPSSNYDEIEKIEFSYDYVNTSSEKEYETLMKRYSGYVNMTQMAIWGYNNNPRQLSSDLWDKLNSIEYKYTKQGIPYGEISHEDDKITYKMEDTQKGFEILTMTPNNK